MLSEIRLTDVGVIEEAELELGPGLTVVTGETGAGKTMVVTGLGLLLGHRADSAIVRTGAARAVVEGVATLPESHPGRVRALDAGADDEEELVLVRIVTNQGRSRAHVGGRSTPVGTLAEVGESLVALHGQADQWRLRHLDQHRELLDRFGGADLLAVRTAHEEAFAEHRAAAEELGDLRARLRERALEAQTLTAGLTRIEQVDPQPGEDAALALEADRLTHVEELRSAAATAVVRLAGDDAAIAGDDTGVLGALATIRQALEHAGANDPRLAELGSRAAELGHLAVDLSAELSAYLADLDVEPGRLDWVQGRRSELSELTKVYGEDIDAVLAWSRDAAVRVGTLLGDDDRLAALTASVQELASARDCAAEALTAARAEAAAALAARITEELAALAMPTSVVEVQVRASGRHTPTGVDEVEIGLRSGSGGQLRPIARSASGGELSRIMLAIEVATATSSNAPLTFVFDEVDAGVGGRAALAVGARLAALAEHAQVIVVTHLAQVAAHADHHLVVRKSDDGQVTRSGVTRVEDEERIQELARMLGGTDSAAALEHARDLLAQVRRG